MELTLIRPNEEYLKQLNVLLDLHFMDIPDVTCSSYIDNESFKSQLIICSDDLNADEKTICGKNYQVPVIMLSKKDSEQLISEFNIYKSTDDFSHSLIHLVTEGIFAKKEVDSFMDRFQSIKPFVLEDIINEEIQNHKTSFKQSISKFEALHNLIKNNTDLLTKQLTKDIQNLKIGLCEVSEDFKDRLKERVKQKKMDINIEHIPFEDWDYRKYDLIITRKPPFGKTLKDNYRVPVFLLCDLPQSVRSDCLKDWNVYKIFSESEEKEMFNEITSVLLAKYEFDKLMVNFKEISDKVHKNQEKYKTETIIDDAHQKDGEAVDDSVFKDLGKNYSRFQEAYLTAISEVDNIVQKNRAVRQGNIFSFYSDLYKETNLSFFLRKSMQVLSGVKNTHLKDWLHEALPGIKEYPEAAAKLLAQYYTQNTEDPDIQFAKHRHNIIKFRVSTTGTQYLVKFSGDRAKNYLSKEEKLLRKYNELNKKISREIDEEYVKMPDYVTSHFPEKDNSERRQNFANFLLFKVAPGKPACAIINDFQDKLKDAAEEKVHTIEKDFEEISSRILSEKIKIIAMAYKIAEESPELVEKIQSQNNEKVREYYVNKIKDTFIFSKKWEKDYPEFQGGLATILLPEQVKDIAETIDDAAGVIADLLIDASPGVMTDRTLRNSLISEKGDIYTVDFETLRDLPTFIDFASTLEMGLASNDKFYTLDQDLYVCGKKVFDKNTRISLTQKRIYSSAILLENELSVVGFSDDQVDKHITRLIPDFQKYEKHYFASACVIDLVGYGTSVRNLITNQSQDEIIDNKYHNQINAVRFWHNAQSNLNQLKRFCSVPEQVQALNKLISKLKQYSAVADESLTKWRKK